MRESETGRERHRERDTQRHRERDTERHRKRERQRDGERDRERGFNYEYYINSIYLSRGNEKIYFTKKFKKRLKFVQSY